MDRSLVLISEQRESSIVWPQRGRPSWLGSRRGSKVGKPWCLWANSLIKKNGTRLLGIQGRRARGEPKRYIYQWDWQISYKKRKPANGGFLQCRKSRKSCGLFPFFQSTGWSHSVWYRNQTFAVLNYHFFFYTLKSKSSKRKKLAKESPGESFVPVSREEERRIHTNPDFR